MSRPQVSETSAPATDAAAHVLYRFFSKTGQLLYVGITMNPPERFKAHRQEKAWWGQVAGITCESYDNRSDLMAAERRAIQVERPKHNVVHNRSQKLHKPAARPVASNRIAYHCCECRKLINAGDGYVHVSRQEAHDHRQYWRELRQRKRAEMAAKGAPGWMPIGYSGSELVNGPPPARWVTHHRVCDPNPDSNDYWFDVARADTAAKLLDWSAHLLGKNWIQDTNWSDFIRSVTRRLGVDA